MLHISSMQFETVCILEITHIQIAKEKKKLEKIFT